MGIWKITCMAKVGVFKPFVVLVDLDKNTFAATGEHRAEFLPGAGTASLQMSGENGLKLYGAEKKWLATFNDLIGATKVGATGTGKTEKKPFDWKLDSKDYK